MTGLDYTGIIIAKIFGNDVCIPQSLYTLGMRSEFIIGFIACFLLVLAIFDYYKYKNETL